MNKKWFNSPDCGFHLVSIMSTSNAMKECEIFTRFCKSSNQEAKTASAHEQEGGRVLSGVGAEVEHYRHQTAAAPGGNLLILIQWFLNQGGGPTCRGGNCVKWKWFVVVNKPTRRRVQHNWKPQTLTDTVRSLFASGSSQIERLFAICHHRELSYTMEQNKLLCAFFFSA